MEGTPYHSSKLHPDLCSSVGMLPGTDRHTHACGQYTFHSAVPNAKLTRIISSPIDMQLPRWQCRRANANGEEKV